MSPTPAQARRALLRGLGPIGPEEVTVDEVISYVHNTACSAASGKVVHDPLCNTMRRLAEDQRHLVRQEKTLTAKLLPELGKLTPVADPADLL